MLFDIVRELNDKMNIMVRRGMPGFDVPMLFGTTDGHTVVITFMDHVVWDSTTWKYSTDDEMMELDRIRFHIQEAIISRLSSLYNIQF